MIKNVKKCSVLFPLCLAVVDQLFYCKFRSFWIVKKTIGYTKNTDHLTVNWSKIFDYLHIQYLTNVVKHWIGQLLPQCMLVKCCCAQSLTSTIKENVTKCWTFSCHCFLKCHGRAELTFPLLATACKLSLFGLSLSNVHLLPIGPRRCSGCTFFFISKIKNEMLQL